MKIIDLKKVIDKDIPIWLNENFYSDRYDNYHDMITSNDSNFYEAEIKYITIDGNGELTIEI